MSEYEASGLSRREFCARRELAVATLDLYRKRARQSGVGPRLLAVEFGPRPAEASSTGMAVVLENGRRIEIGQRVDAVLLTELIGIVERA